MEILRLVVYRFFEAQWYARYFDTSSNEWLDQAIDGGEVVTYLQQLETDFPAPGFGWQCGVAIGGIAEYVFDRAAIPS